MKTTNLISEKNKFTFTCKLTSPELQQRKKTVIASLKKNVLEKKELKNGFTYKFNGTDQMIDDLSTFIKTERLCCDFFNFKLVVNTDDYIWLELSGPAGVKDFIQAELAL